MKTMIPFLFYQLPEAFLLLITALGLLGLRIRLGRLIIAGLCLGLLTQIARFYLLTISMHTPVIVAGLATALTIGFQLSLPSAITGCFLSFFLLLMGESLLASPVLTWTKITYESTLANPWLSVAFGWLSAGFLILASLISHIGKFVLIKVPETKSTSYKTNN